MNRQEKRNLRRDMAESVASGTPISEVCAEFEYSPHSVINACREFGVPVPRDLRMGDETYVILANLINTPISQHQLSRDRGVSVQYINQIARRALGAGIKIHPERELRA